MIVYHIISKTTIINLLIKQLKNVRNTTHCVHYFNVIKIYLKNNKMNITHVAVYHIISKTAIINLLVKQLKRADENVISKLN